MHMSEIKKVPEANNLNLDFSPFYKLLENEFDNDINMISERLVESVRLYCENLPDDFDHVALSNHNRFLFKLRDVFLQMKKG